MGTLFSSYRLILFVNFFFEQSLMFKESFWFFTSGVLKKAKKRELKETQKNKINSDNIPALEDILKDVYAICHPKPVDYFNRKDLVRVFNAIAKEIYGNYAELVSKCVLSRIYRCTYMHAICTGLCRTISGSPSTLHHKLLFVLYWTNSCCDFLF